MLRWTPVVSRAVIEILGEDLIIPAFGWVTGGVPLLPQSS
jgi:hypothetical protein